MLLLFGSRDLSAALTEGLRVTDSLLQSGNLARSLTESVRVADQPVQRAFDNDLVAVLTESVKPRDQGQGVTRLTGAIRVTDGPIIAVRSAAGGALSVLLTESVRAADADNSWAELTYPEGVRVTETITAVRLNYGGGLAREDVRVRDLITAERVGAGAPTAGLTHAISIARHGRTRFHLVRLPFVVAAWGLGQLIDTRVRSLVFDRNHGTWEGAGTLTRGVPMRTIPEGEMGATLDGNVWVRVPNDGDGFVVPGDAAGRTLSLANGDADIVALIVCTRNDSVLRPIAQKQNTNSAGSGWHLAMQNGQLRGFGKVGATTMFSVACTYPIGDNLEHWVQLHVDTVAGFAHLIIDGVDLAQEHFVGEFGLTAADMLIGAFNDLPAGGGFIGTIALVALARQGDPTICATLDQARVWDDITVDVRVESSPVIAEHGRRDPQPLTRIAGPGTFACILDNALNAAGLEGRYTPDHANVLPGFEEGIPIKWEVTDASTGLTHTFFRGEIAEIEVEPGRAKQHRVEVRAETWLARTMRWRVGPLPVQLAIRSDNAVRWVVDQAGRPPLAVTFAVGDATFPVTFDLLEARTPIYAELGRLALNEGGLLYEHPDGTLVFESQTQRYLHLTTDATWTEYDLETLDARRAADAVINSMPTTITPVEVGDSATAVLASMSNRLLVVPGASVVVELTYRDEAQPDARVGGTELVTPVPVTDYTMSAEEDGGGTDLTGFAVVAAPAATQGGTSVKLTFTNTHPTLAGYVQTQIRGRALKRFDSQTFPFQHDESIFERDLREQPLTLDYQTNVEQAESFVRQVLALRRAPFMAPRQATRRGVDAATQADLLTRRIGDVVALQEPVTGLLGTERTFIEGIGRTFGRENTLVGVYSLDRGPAAQSFAVLDEVGFAELDETAVLA
jgi:hypothetical protein